MDNKIKAVLSMLGGIVGYLFGGLDALLEVFLIILLVDTITGMTKSYYNGTYRSKRFRQGLWQTLYTKKAAGKIPTANKSVI